MDKVMARMNAAKHRETRKHPRVQARRYATVAEMLSGDNTSYVGKNDAFRVTDVDTWRKLVARKTLLWSPQSLPCL